MNVAQDTLEDAQNKLDAHLREIVQWHFDPETGCPFWLDYAQKLDFDPREKIHSYDDLALLGHFEDEWLRGGPVRDASNRTATRASRPRGCPTRRESPTPGCKSSAPPSGRRCGGPTAAARRASL